MERLGGIPPFEGSLAVSRRKCVSVSFELSVRELLRGKIRTAWSPQLVLPGERGRGILIESSLFL